MRARCACCWCPARTSWDRTCSLRSQRAARTYGSQRPAPKSATLRCSTSTQPTGCPRPPIRRASSGGCSKSSPTPRIDLIVPCRDEDVARVSEFAQHHAQAVPRACCAAPSTWRGSFATSGRVTSSPRAHGLPFAPTLVNASSHAVREFIARHGFPLVAKPRDGFASHGVSFCVNEGQLRAALARPNYVLQRVHRRSRRHARGFGRVRPTGAFRCSSRSRA